MSYFEGAQNFTQNGGRFGTDCSRHTNGPDDYSQHITTYGTYVNHGQHAENRGTINNYGSQTTNNGPIHGYTQYFANNDWFSVANNRRAQWPPGPPDDEDFRYGPANHPPNHRHRQTYPPQEPPIDTGPTYEGGDDFGGEEFNGHEADNFFPPPTAQARTASPHYAQGQQRSRRGDSLDEELEKLSPDMQRYVQSLIQQWNTSQVPNERSERELPEDMARMNIDDAEPSSRPFNAPGSPLPHGARSLSPHFSGSYQDDFEDDRRRTVITNTDSGNFNSTTVVDSHNDNSTRTEIFRGLGYAAR